MYTIQFIFFRKQNIGFDNLTQMESQAFDHQNDIEVPLYGTETHTCYTCNEKFQLFELEIHFLNCKGPLLTNQSEENSNLDQNVFQESEKFKDEISSEIKEEDQDIEVEKTGNQENIFMALRAFPAFTRLTVERRLQVFES